jgi:hypothetical protein
MRHEFTFKSRMLLSLEFRLERPSGRFAIDNRLAELTIEPKLIVPSRDALKSLGIRTQLYARLIWAFGGLNMNCSHHA